MNYKLNKEYMIYNNGLIEKLIMENKLKRSFIKNKLYYLKIAKNLENNYILMEQMKNLII